MSEEWSPWFEHDGSGCPVPTGAGAVVQYRNTGVEAATVMGGRSWFWCMRGGVPQCDPRFIDPIIRYRIRRPPAVQLLVDIAETLPVRELEDA
jgi:hypothetical protein